MDETVRLIPPWRLVGTSLTGGALIASAQEDGTWLIRGRDGEVRAICPDEVLRQTFRLVPLAAGPERGW